MIAKGGKTAIGIMRGNKKVTRVYRGSMLVFDTVEPGSGLPAEYQAIEYIHFGGSSYIYLGHYPTQETKMEIKLTVDQTRGVWSSNSGSGLSNNFTGYLGNSNNNNRFGNKTVSTSLSLNTPHVVEQSKDGFYIDGNLKGDYDGYRDFTSTQELRIGYNTVYFVGDVYYIKLWSEGVLIHDFIACKRKSDGVAGLYDLVTEGFFVSDTSTDVTAGSEI